MENYDNLINQLNKWCGDSWVQLPNGKFSIPCPREHELKSPFVHPNIIYSPVTNYGECGSCGTKYKIEPLLAALEAKFKAKQANHKVESETPLSSASNNKAEAPVVLPTIYSWKDFSKLEFPWANQWRVKGLIPISARCVIAAPSGEGKSWLGMAIAKSVAAGTPFLGNPLFVTTQCKVLYIENESAKDDFIRRGKRLDFHEIEENLFTVHDDFPPLKDKKNADALLAFAVQNEIGCIIIDTFRSVSGGIRENEAEEIRRFFDNFKPFMARGITVIILDHTRKPLPFEGGMIPRKEQLLGSQDKFSAPEAVIMLRSKTNKTEHGETANVFIYAMKNKGGSAMRPFQADIIHVDDPDGGGSTKLAYVKEIEEKVLQVAVASDSILEYLVGQTEPRTTAEIVEALKGKVGKSAVETALQDLRAGKKVGFKREGIGSKYLYWLLGDEDAGSDSLPSLFEDRPAS